MVEQLRSVGISEVVTSADVTDVLVVYGLGSCVAVCLYDPAVRAGGILHALLPKEIGQGGPPAKFVDQGLPLLVNSLLRLGARVPRLRGALCGGANMLDTPILNGQFDVGRRNLQVARQGLQALGIPVTASATGGNYGRTAKLYLADGKITVRSLLYGEQTLVPPVREPTWG